MSRVYRVATTCPRPTLSGQSEAVICDPARIETVLETLAELWKRSPDQRLGQLLINISGNHAKRLGQSATSDVWHVEDELMLEEIEHMLEHGWTRSPEKS